MCGAIAKGHQDNTVISDNDVWNCGSILDVLAPTMRLLHLIPWFVTHAHKAFEQNCHGLAYRNSKHFSSYFCHWPSKMALNIWQSKVPSERAIAIKVVLKSLAYNLSMPFLLQTFSKCNNACLQLWAKTDVHILQMWTSYGKARSPGFPHRWSVSFS